MGLSLPEEKTMVRNETSYVINSLGQQEILETILEPLIRKLSGHRTASLDSRSTEARSL